MLRPYLREAGAGGSNPLTPTKFSIIYAIFYSLRHIFGTVIGTVKTPTFALLVLFLATLNASAAETLIADADYARSTNFSKLFHLFWQSGDGGIKLPG